MSAPVLVPAFACVMRVGLPVICDIEPDSGRLCDVRLDVPAVVISLYGMDVEPGPWLTVGTDDRGRCGEREEVLARHTRLDLRDPAVRDAVGRAIWHKLRPTEPEPLTAPAFHWLGSAGNYATAWVMEVRDPPHGLTLSCGFVAARYPALASIPLDSPDRDLLALACVAAAVLS